VAVAGCLCGIGLRLAWVLRMGVRWGEGSGERGEGRGERGDVDEIAD